jgi:hypothetical protein
MKDPFLFFCLKIDIFCVKLRLFVCVIVGKPGRNQPYPKVRSLRQLIHDVSCSDLAQNAGLLNRCQSAAASLVKDWTTKIFDQKQFLINHCLGSLGFRICITVNQNSLNPICPAYFIKIVDQILAWLIFQSLQRPIRKSFVVNDW